MPNPNNLSVDYQDGILKVCILNTWPSVDDVIAAFAINGGKSDFFAGIQWPSLESIYRGYSIISDTIKELLLGILQPLLKVLGQDVDTFLAGLQSVWEGVIGFPAKISDIISGTPAAINNLVAALTAAYTDLNIRPNLTWLPLPIFGKTSMLPVEIMHIIQELMKNFYLFLIEQIANKIQPIVDAVKALTGGSFSLPSIPQMPSMNGLLAILKEKMKLYGNDISLAWEGLKTDIANQLGVIGEAIKSIPKLAKNFISGFSVPDVEIQAAKSNFMTLILKAIVDWISTNIVDPVVNAVKNLVSGLVWPPAIFPFCISIPVGPILTYTAIQQLEKYNL